MRIRRLLVLGAALLPLLDAVPVSAIPAFARKYRVSCSMCHAPVPRLNHFGEEFAGNGFEFAPGEAPTDTIDTGDPLLRLMEALPLAVRIDSYLQFSPAADGARVDLQVPWGIKLLSGGQIADKVSYYAYFFLSERGEVAGLEDAYVQFTDVAGSGVSLLVGQFQVSDPLFKRELRLTVEDYQAYRVRVGDARSDLTYDRGIMGVWSPWDGGDVALQVVNGRGLEEAGENRRYDTDSWKNFAARFSQSFGPLRVGAFGMLANEEQDGIVDEVRVFGPDLTLALGERVELNAQYLRRTDDDPFFLGAGTPGDTEVDAGFVELIYQPQGPQGRWFVTALYNDVRADDAVFTLRSGEEHGLSRYTVGSLGLSWVQRRNLRLHGEAGYDFDASKGKLTLGFTAAF
ncbi:MAG TPA: hypothetical protein VK928_09370 [Longimicrobiales bacterium]|nr:hypothetical protein [Longimicrobiales bacterium]